MFNTTFYISEGLSTLAEYNQAGALEYEYVYGADGIIAQLNAAGTKEWYYKDHLGSTRQVNAAGYVDYYPFGQEITNTSLGTDYKFTGKEQDATGLYYYGARYYDPTIGRFLSIDPLSEKYPSITPYNYTMNNPLRFVDPDGMCPRLQALYAEMFPEKYEEMMWNFARSDKANRKGMTKNRQVFVDESSDDEPSGGDPTGDKEGGSSDHLNKQDVTETIVSFLLDLPGNLFEAVYQTIVVDGADFADDVSEAAGYVEVGGFVYIIATKDVANGGAVVSVSSVVGKTADYTSLGLRIIHSSRTGDFQPVFDKGLGALKNVGVGKVTGRAEKILNVIERYKEMEKGVNSALSRIKLPGINLGGMGL